MPKQIISPEDDAPFIRLATAAHLSGLSLHAFTKGVERGQIAVPILQIGRLRYVRQEAFAAWLFPKPQKNADLF